MEETFISLVVKEYLELNKLHPNKVCIVFPNRRTGVFLRKELLKQLPETQWMPEWYSAEEFVGQLTSLKPLDSVTQLFEFYAVYKEMEGDDAESFDQFQSWGDQLLHDFNEIDLYLVDTNALFGNINAAYAIKMWSPDLTEPSPLQQEYLRFWSKLNPWYTGWKNHLKKNTWATHASMYRYLAEQLNPILDEARWEKIIFAGFNALNAAEKKLFQALRKRNKGIFLWDCDPYYMDNQAHEAGIFLREHHAEFGHELVRLRKPLISSLKRTISITGVSKNTGQAVVAGHILDELAKSGADLTQTAVVLADESILMPLMEQLPDSIESANITMGYPLHLMPLSGLFQLSLELLQHKKDGKTPVFYFAYLVRFFKHPTIASIFPPQLLHEVVLKINSDNRIYRSFNSLPHASDKLSSIAFLFGKNNQDAGTILGLLVKLADLLREEWLLNEKQYAIELDALLLISRIIKRLIRWSKDYEELLSVEFISKTFGQLVRKETLSFYGEPLKGLQIMGLLETRNLDFKNLIILSVNENLLPLGKVHKSFIPFDISKAHKLPTYRERDAIYAYHFYRLIQRAENVHLIYNSETDEFGKGEQSRFITQLEQELQGNSNTIFARKDFVIQLSQPEEPPIIIQKTPEIISFLKTKYASPENKERGLSPTALNSFIQCSLKFYLNYVAGVRDEDEIQEEIGADIIGSALHKALEWLFLPYVNEQITAVIVSKMLVEAPALIKKAFAEFVEDEMINEGTNLLLYKSASRMFTNYLKNYQKQLADYSEPPVILELEKKLHRTLNIDSANGALDVNLSGTIDRIEKVGDILRIIDYKSGGVDKNELKYKELGYDHQPSKIAKAMQLMHYAFLGREYDKMAPIQAGIHSLKYSSSGLMFLAMEGDELLDERHEKGIAYLLNMHLSDLFSENEPFKQTTDKNVCLYCSFKEMCNR